MSLQHCLLLAVATGAVWTDLQFGKIPNTWILAAWIAGLLTQIFRFGIAGAWTFLVGAAIPILCLYWLFYFHMLGAGDIKLLSVIGGFLGFPAIFTCIGLSFIFGAILSFGIILVCGNLLQRLTIFIIYFQNYFQTKRYDKRAEPVPYNYDSRGMECIHFSVPVLLGVLLRIGGFY